jgi:hypothetical protein
MCSINGCSCRQPPQAQGNLDRNLTALGANEVEVHHPQADRLVDEFCVDRSFVEEIAIFGWLVMRTACVVSQ